MNPQPVITPVPWCKKFLWIIPYGGAYMKLFQPLTINIGVMSITVPKDFVTDGASIPWIFRRILACISSYFCAAVVHDFLYRGGVKNMTRSEADDIMWELAANDHTPFWERWVIHAGLWLGGQSAWDKYKDMSQKGTLDILWGDLKV